MTLLFHLHQHVIFLNSVNLPNELVVFVIQIHSLIDHHQQIGKIRKLQKLEKYILENFKIFRVR